MSQTGSNRPSQHKQQTAVDTESVRYGIGTSLTEFKKAMGQYAAKYDDSEIERLLVISDTMADVFFDAWIKNRNAA